MTQLTPITASSMLSRADSLVATEVEKEVVIVSLENGFFFLLNNTASRIWDLLETPRALGTITDALVARFAVDPDQCSREVSEFVQVMLERDLLKRA